MNPICDTNRPYVDLGLSVLWSSCNLMASCPQERGIYHALAWGDDLTRRGIPVQTPNNPMGCDEGWRKPTRSEFEELFLCCELYWGDYLGTTGLTAISKVYPNNYIFLPTTGWLDLDGSTHDEGKCLYWTCDAYKYDHNFAWSFQFDEKVKNCLHSYIGLGYSIRLVHSR
jgi:uncharacterized protein (TIGR02145 family)